MKSQHSPKCPARPGPCSSFALCGCRSHDSPPDLQFLILGPVSPFPTTAVSRTSPPMLLRGSPAISGHGIFGSVWKSSGSVSGSEPVEISIFHSHGYENSAPAGRGVTFPEQILSEAARRAFCSCPAEPSHRGLWADFSPSPAFIIFLTLK